MQKRRRTNGKEAKETRLRIGPVQQKILLLLLGGLALSCSRSPEKSWRIIKGMRESWKEINRRAAERAINALYDAKLLETKVHSDGTTTLVLNEGGKKKALTYKADRIKIMRPSAWDRKWRVVIFDIPEDEREARDALRAHLEYMGFYILQRSVFVCPFECRDQIEFLIELYAIRRYVRFMVVEYIDNEDHLKKNFRIK
ncbi:MAG: phenylacetic acid degradation operon negative regulatory protein [Parcubacteria group bacterium Greene0416_79]|nr:MAG: phenylacetic acid degradation operon negative regulatory protein [Parcubacteria group bacterium Greene0416_79]